MPDLGSNEGFLKMHPVGIGSSDASLWEHGRIGYFVMKKPMVLGYEAAGIVTKKELQ
jgi:Zn-dependent alcohol dehydrogenase